MSEQEIREAAVENVTPEWFKLYENANPQMKRLNEEPIENFEERRRTATRKLIQEENDRRAARGEKPITLVGIHAAPRGDTLSSQMLYRMSESAENVGIHRALIELSDENGKLDPAAIERAVEEIKSSDGILISTHTKGGRFNTYATMLLEALEEVDLKGKIVGFSHTYADPEKDEQVGPLKTAQSFFRSKGSLMVPYTFMYANTEAIDEEWVQQDIVGNGVRLARGMERLSKSGLMNFLDDPEKLEQRKVDGELSPEWKELRKKVAAVNEERRANGEKPLNVLFMLGGAEPAVVERRDEESGEMKRVPGGRGARISKLLAKNFEFLGLETRTIHLASEDERMESTSGNPNLDLSNVLEGKEESESDAATREMYRSMLEADMIIFNSPVRWFSHTGQLQKIIERMTPLEASGYLLEGKAFGTIITFGEAGGSEMQAHLEHFAMHNGLMTVPFGGLNQHLTMEKEEWPGLPTKEAHGMAARSAAFLVEYIAVNGGKVEKIDFKGLRHGLEEIVSPGD